MNLFEPIGAKYFNATKLGNQPCEPPCIQNILLTGEAIWLKQPASPMAGRHSWQQHAHKFTQQSNLVVATLFLQALSGMADK
ncbi:MAG: hypothetical protein C0391_07200 [Anaerolinea sp.]|nr:hypothetical protein [Anaerolinea sp.]